jgi:hypothetical protein
LPELGLRSAEPAVCLQGVSRIGKD